MCAVASAPEGSALEFGRYVKVRPTRRPPRDLGSARRPFVLATLGFARGDRLAGGLCRQSPRVGDTGAALRADGGVIKSAF
jgi:hypothetical protein